MAPKVTIGMPLYNGEAYLRDALEAIQNQTFEDFQLIVSDNGSTDGSAEICRAAAAQDARIQYFLQPKNLGAIGNFNALVQMATGQYFKWAACDDLMEPGFLESCVEVLDTHADVAWCHTVSDMIDSRGRSFLDLLPADDEELQIDEQGRRTWAGLPRRDYDSDDPIRRFRGVVLGTNWCVDSYGLFRLSALKRTRMLQQFYGAEKALMAEVSLQGIYHEIPKLMFYQRVHDKASSNLNTAQSQASFADTRHRMKRFFFARFNVPSAHVCGLLASDLNAWQKARGCWVVVLYFFQFAKWKRVLTKAIRGTGLGGGGSRVLESARNAQSTGNTEILNQSKPPV